MSVPLNSNDKSVVIIVSAICAAAVALGAVLTFGAYSEDWAPQRSHRVIPPEAQEAAAQYTLNLKMASTAVSSAVGYAQKIFGVCCNCGSAESHDTPYVDQAIREIIEEEVAIETVADMFASNDLDHTTYVGLATMLEGEQELPGELIAANWADVPLPPVILCSNPCCQD